MTQAETRTLLETSAKSISAAYFDIKDEAARDTFMKLETDINGVLTTLNQDDLESRTEEFASAAATMQKSVLPAIKQLDASIEKIIAVEGAVKVALTDLVKLSSTVSFFKIPAI